MKSIKSQQSGFTLVEIAIVLVIIGLLLGGVLKGQELINSAKVKNLAQDFKNVELYIYGYQDRFKALPGDDTRAQSNLPSSTLPAPSTADNGNGNGVIEGAWDATSGESWLFWRHVRATNFAPGSVDASDTSTTGTYTPRNVDGGRVGITNGQSANTPITGMTGTYVFCSAGILGKFAKQLDTTLDDGNTATGSFRVRATSTTLQSAAIPTSGAGGIDDALSYTVCKSF